MQIQLKKLGKKKIKIIDISLEKHPKTLRELITECVKSEVRRFNDSREDTSLLPFLSAKEIGEQAQAGKITFGENFLLYLLTRKKFKTWTLPSI